MDKSKSRTYKAMAYSIVVRLNGRAYSVGFDLGPGSIGVAVVAMEPDEHGVLYPTELVFACSRIFPSSAGAKARREKRGQRNAIRHKAHRMEKLWRLLAERDLMLPYSKDDAKDPARLRFREDEIRKDPYSLRLKGLTEKLSLYELGVALYHIAGHRGASSIRTFIDGSAKEEKESEMLRKTEEICRNEHLNTFIEVLYKFRQDNGTSFRNTKKAQGRTPLPTRDIIESELDLLLSKQCGYYPDVLDCDYVRKIKDTILFENEKIVPEAGNCPYFPDEKKLPRASFINEERRIWEAVNNVRIEKEVQYADRFKTVREPLTDTERKQLYDLLRCGKDVSAAGFKRLFPQYRYCKQIILQGPDKKTQNITGFRFKKLEDSPWFSSMSEELQLEFIQEYISCPDDKKLRGILADKFNLTATDIEEALRLQLVEGYAPVGISAMKIILEYIIRDRLSYQEAEAKAAEEGKLYCRDADIVYDFLPYYGQVIPASTQALAGKAWHSVFADKKGKKGFITPFTNKDEERYGRIANPVVHQTLNELRKLMNELLEVIGYKPETICIELARELKVGKEKRDKISKDNSKQEADNKKVFDEFCKPHNLSKKFIKHFRLLSEQKCKCPYCLKTISVDDVVKHNVDIDHIYPIDDTGDSSYNNLVLAHKTCNESKKAKRIPYAAFSSDPVLWSKMEQYVTENLPAAKAARFQTTTEEYDEMLERKDFKPRFAPDNAYIARIACKYLSCLYAKEDRLSAVRTIRGSETAVLRKAWGLNSITNDLAKNISSESEYENKKNRSDHRHHALDAIVAAYFTPGYSTIIESANAAGHSWGEIVQRLPIPKYYRLDKSLSKKEQVTAFRNEIKNFIFNSTYISIKQNINKNGSLVKDTQYKILSLNENDVVICTQKMVSDIKVEKLEGKTSKSLSGLLNKKFVYPAFLNDKDKSLINKLLKANSEKYDSISGLMESAREQLEDENSKREADGLKPRLINERTILSRACSLAGGIYYQIENKKRNKLFMIGVSSAFDTDENYSLDLFIDKKGKMNGEVIRKINSVDKDFKPQYEKDGYTLFERLYPKDVLEIDLVPAIGSGKKALSQSFITPNAPEGKTYVVIDTFTETGKTIHVYFTPIITASDNVGSSFYVSGISKLNARKVVLSRLGLVVYRSQLLLGGT